jgi:hypothetical protein
MLQDRPCLLPWPKWGVRGAKITRRFPRYPPEQICSYLETSGRVLFPLMGLEGVVLTPPSRYTRPHTVLISPPGRRRSYLASHL